MQVSIATFIGSDRLGRCPSIQRPAKEEVMGEERGEVSDSHTDPQCSYFIISWVRDRLRPWRDGEKRQ